MKELNKGFTLVELMVVIVIMGILAALAIPKLSSVPDKAKWSEVPTMLASYESAQLAYLAETGSLGALTDLVFDSTSSKWFTYSSPANGTYQAVVAGSASIGGIATGKGVQTTVDINGVVKHAVVTGTDSTAIKKMIPNFFK